jgi:hypothetical protein
MGKCFFELSFNKLYTNIFWNMITPERLRKIRAGTCCLGKREGSWDLLKKKGVRLGFVLWNTLYYNASPTVPGVSSETDATKVCKSSLDIAG